MKEYIKLSNNLQSAYGYIIEDIPFTITVKRKVFQHPRQQRVFSRIIDVNKDIIIEPIIYQATSGVSPY